MLAPRRVGKTSVLYHLLDQPMPGWRAGFVSVESAISENDLVARLLKCAWELKPEGTFWSRFSVGIRTALQSVDQIDGGPVKLDLAGAIGNRWQDIGADLLRMLAGLQEKTLFLVDEFPVFISSLLAEKDGENRVRSLMTWFREIRNAPQIAEEVHFVLTGSIGLDAIVKMANMSATINDLNVFQLGPLSYDLADTMLERLGEGEELPLPLQIRKRILERLIWPIPFHIQLFFAELLAKVKFRGLELTTSLVDQVYDELLSFKNRKHFEHWHERLHHRMEVPKERDLKREILKAAALDPAGVGADSIIQIRNKIAKDINEEAVLQSLQHDGYIVHDDGRWRFASSLLRDWWHRWVVSRA
jgi:hypothetical protein